MTRWIPTSQETPEVDVPVLAFWVEEGAVAVAFRCSEVNPDYWEHADSGDWAQSPPDFWSQIELPDLPEDVPPVSRFEREDVI